MNRTILAMAVAAGVIAAAPVMAQQNQEKTDPLQLKAEQVKEIQQKLNKQGFSAGHDDGLWGPDTSTAVKNFQEKKGLQATGQLDQKTLKALGVDASSSSGSSRMTQQEAQQKLAGLGYTQVQLGKQGGGFSGTASKSGTPYQVMVSQDGKLTEQSKPMTPAVADVAPLGVVAASAATLAQNTTTPAANPPATTPGTAVDKTLGTNATSTNPGANAPESTPANPPATTPGTAVDKTVGTNATGANPGANAPGGTPANSPATTPGAAVDKTLGTNATGTNPGGSNAGTNAASGNDNQVVATTNANAMQPAHGANSFSRGEASTRIAGHGFQNVSDLHKDGNGVWRGKATKDGQPISVWLDYKGNVGQQ